MAYEKTYNYDKKIKVFATLDPKEKAEWKKSHTLKDRLYFYDGCFTNHWQNFHYDDVRDFIQEVFFAQDDEDRLKELRPWLEHHMQEFATGALKKIARSQVLQNYLAVVRTILLAVITIAVILH